MKHNIANRVRAVIVADIPPQPAAHGVAVGMDHEDTERRCRDGVDTFAVSKLQATEEQKQADPGGQRQNLIGIRNKEIAEPDPFSDCTAEPYEHDNAAQESTRLASASNPVT